jgi:hypothetical protein
MPGPTTLTAPAQSAQSHGQHLDISDFPPVDAGNSFHPLAEGRGQVLGTADPLGKPGVEAVEQIVPVNGIFGVPTLHDGFDVLPERIGLRSRL